MPRITKAMLENENLELLRAISDLRERLRNSEERVKFLEKYSQVQYLNSYVIAHEKEVDALTHSLTAVVSLLRKER